jgi:hypothetical protein
MKKNKQPKLQNRQNNNKRSLQSIGGGIILRSAIVSKA